MDIYADNPGVLIYHCHVNDHIKAGMLGTYTVSTESCVDCVGIFEDTKSTESEDDRINDVLVSNETWIIVLFSFIIN